jgi:hypothetical protein
MPKRGRNSKNSLFVPPYESLTETTRSPGESSVKSVSLMAAMPLAKLVAAAAPSSRRTFVSSASTVGLVFRE